ncbi:hypothetical protein [Streptomyces olivochromogenes]|uniref:Pyruvate dehydrogenase n=1 Tax=Streptomyces olivochromogenes TaxID=1963 RepID=A0A250VUY2_STROL|nr:hypothetical protein [Streptomyces olivochromogenes]KUN35905.1 hypothetical protein AQJ27_48090 [Streptomyces olivochromogenes]GAX57915.1 pyruvate dehydrogenase [Streptomyces olivochromogenes]
MRPGWSSGRGEPKEYPDLTTEDQLEDALRAAFEHDGPALVDVRVARHELSLPPKLSYGQIKGFTLYATRTILSGGVDELVELTKTNLRQLEGE